MKKIGMVVIGLVSLFAACSAVILAWGAAQPTAYAVHLWRISACEQLCLMGIIPGKIQRGDAIDQVDAVITDFRAIRDQVGLPDEFAGWNIVSPDNLSKSLIRITLGVQRGIVIAVGLGITDSTKSPLLGDVIKALGQPSCLFYRPVNTINRLTIGYADATSYLLLTATTDYDVKPTWSLPLTVLSLSRRDQTDDWCKDQTPWHGLISYRRFARGQ